MRALLASAPNLNQAARQLVHDVLRSLAEDPATEETAQREIALLLDALKQPTSLRNVA